jgi:chromate reductase
MRKVAVFVGSLRNGSINLKLAKALAKLGHRQFDFNFIEIGDLPMYNEDLEGNLPASVVRLKQEIIAADAVLIVTPEYNRSIPPVLKNAIDWGSRPWGQ